MGSPGFIRRSIRAMTIAITALAALNACAPAGSKSQKDYLKECGLAADQRASLYGRWSKLAVPIVFRAGQWSGEEMAAIMDAADVWNEFYLATSGARVLDYGTRDSPNMLSFNKPAGDICSYTIFDDVTSRYTSGVVIYKQTLWPYGSMSSAIALTSYCKKSGTGSLPSLFMGVMEANYQNFFTAGQKQPDLKSIFVHELGHLLGLDHSCAPSSASATAGLVACGSVQAAKPEYKDAVMYPTVFFYSDGTSLEKRELEANDQSRANCLYGPQAI